MSLPGTQAPSSTTSSKTRSRPRSTKRALGDLRRIDYKSRKRLLDLLEHDLATEPQPANLDVKPLTGCVPWLRLLRGEYHVLYRPLTSSDLRALAATEQAGFLWSA